MWGSDLVNKHKITPQYVRAKTKAAKDEESLFVEFGDKKYNYELRHQAKGRPKYFYKELSNKPQEIKLNLKLKVMISWNDFKSNKKGGVKKFVDEVVKTFDIKYTQKMHFDWCRHYKENGARGLVDYRGGKSGVTFKLNDAQQRFLICQFRAFGAGGANYTQLWEDMHRQEEKLMVLILWVGKKVKLEVCATVVLYLDL